MWPTDAQIVFVGEFPDADEESNGEVFSGRVGKLLEKIIRASGIDYASIARTCLVKVAPRAGYTPDDFYREFYVKVKQGKRTVIEPHEDLSRWTLLLQQEISHYKPNVIVACGNEALKALTGYDGIHKSRGSILPCVLVRNCKVVAITAPSQILRGGQWQELYISSEILARKVAPHADSSKINYEGWEEHLAPTIEDWNSYVRRVDGPFTLDIETRAGSIACVGIDYYSGGIDRAICVPLQTTRGPYFDDVANEYEFWRGLQWLCERFPLIGHNVFYDLDWLLDYGIMPHDVHDTMLLFHRFYPELPKSLAFCNMWFTDIPYYKDDGKTWGRNKPDEQLWEYNIKDVVSDHRVWRALNELSHVSSRAAATMELYQKYTRACMPIAFEMQTLGMDADGESVLFAKAILLAELDKIRGRLDALSNGELVIRPGNKKITDQQAAKYLYQTLKLPPKFNRKTKSLTADEDALVELLIKFPDLEVLKALNAERKFGKALNSYIDISWRNSYGQSRNTDTGAASTLVAAGGESLGGGTSPNGPLHGGV